MYMAGTGVDIATDTSTAVWSHRICLSPLAHVDFILLSLGMLGLNREPDSCCPILPYYFILFYSIILCSIQFHPTLPYLVSSRFASYRIV
jgi:hypothetical protein